MKKSSKFTDITYQKSPHSPNILVPKSGHRLLEPQFEIATIYDRTTRMLIMLKSKIHSVTATGSDLHYEGSIAIDQSLMEMANIHEFEKVSVWNKTNGSRHETYAIKAPPGSGEITVNGAAAHLVNKGDELIIATFTMLDQSKAASHKPTIVLIKQPGNKGYLK